MDGEGGGIDARVDVRAPVAAEPQHAVGRLAVIAHRDKTFGPGLEVLRRRIEASPWARDLWWAEVDKSRGVPEQVHAALGAGATRVVVWGGDGTVQRAVDALRSAAAEPDVVTLAVMPAGTANLFAANLRIPHDFEQSLAIALGPRTTCIDVGSVNGECFVAMAGTGLDAMMIRSTSKRMKHRFGRAGYVWSAVRNARRAARPMAIEVDGELWFAGRGSCALVGNVGHLFGGLTVFDQADPTDGLLEVCVISAESLREWALLLVRSLRGSAVDSPWLASTRARRVLVRLTEPAPYELDGGSRKPSSQLKFRIEPLALRVCVP